MSYAHVYGGYSCGCWRIGRKAGDRIEQACVLCVVWTMSKIDRGGIEQQQRASLGTML